MLFQLTAKARDLARLGPADLVAPPANDPAPFTRWYVNVFRVGRSACLHVTEAATFYTLVAPAPRASSATELGVVLREHLRGAFVRGGLDALGAARVLDDDVDVFAKTSSKRVLGCMNEQAGAFDAFIAEYRSVEATPLDRANAWLNEQILRPLGMRPPIEAMRDALAELKVRSSEP